MCRMPSRASARQTAGGRQHLRGHPALFLVPGRPQSSSAVAARARRGLPIEKSHSIRRIR